MVYFILLIVFIYSLLQAHCLSPLTMPLHAIFVAFKWFSLPAIKFIVIWSCVSHGRGFVRRSCILCNKYSSSAWIQFNVLSAAEINCLFNSRSLFPETNNWRIKKLNNVRNWGLTVVHVSSLGYHKLSNSIPQLLLLNQYCLLFLFGIL